MNESLGKFSPNLQGRRVFLRNTTLAAFGWFAGPLDFIYPRKTDHYNTLRIAIVADAGHLSTMFSKWGATSAKLIAACQPTGGQVQSNNNYLTTSFHNDLKSLFYEHNNFDAVIVGIAERETLYQVALQAAKYKKHFYFDDNGTFTPLEITAVANGFTRGTFENYQTHCHFFPFFSTPINYKGNLQEIYCFAKEMDFPKELYNAAPLGLLQQTLKLIYNHKLTGVECCLTRRQINFSSKVESLHLVFHYKNEESSIKLHWLSGNFQPLYKKDCGLVEGKGILLQGQSHEQTWKPYSFFDKANDAKKDIAIYQNWIDYCSDPISSSSLSDQPHCILLAAAATELMLAGNLAIEGFNNLRLSQPTKFLPGNYFRFDWDATSLNVVSRDDLKQFYPTVIQQMLAS